MDSIKKPKCDYCDRHFQKRAGLTRHLRNVHKELSASTRNWTLKCPAAACEEVFKLRSELRDHIQLGHGEKLLKEEIKFLSFEAFEVWKHKMEKEMNCSYVLRQSPKRSASGTIIYYYSCFRSGSFVSKSRVKNRMKCKESIKIKGCCPSTIDAIKRKRKVFVTFWKTHFGHDVQMGHSFLFNDEYFTMSKHHERGIIKCLECNINYENLQMLREHLATHHDSNYVEEEISFPNMIAFKEWKSDIERRDHTFFFAAHETQKRSKYNRCLYRCHQTGSYEASDYEDEHRINSDVGSIKLGITCTASISVCEYEQEVHVKYCLQHYGHGQGTNYVQLSAEEQAAIDENVSNGIPLQEQLDDIKHAQSLAGHFEARLIKIRDMKFLKSAHASEIHNSGMRAIENVEQWVRSCSEMEDSPILLYRNEGMGTRNENLMLIIMTEFQKHILLTSTKEVVCLDSHRCSKKGNFFTALVVMDEHDVAFPVAFCISSKLNKSSMLEFFSSVKESTGPLSCLYLMSNNDSFYCEAWQEVMQDESRWIWNVSSFDDNVRKHLVQSVKHVPTREATYRLIRTIMECNNQNVFVTMLKNFFNSLSDNALCYDFRKFFELQYGYNQEMWAFCYRKDLKFSSNFNLECLHKTLLYCFRKSRNKQLDKTLMVLMKYLRFKMINRFSNMLDEEKIDLSKKAISMCHNLSLNLGCENIHFVLDKTWLIRSEYEVDAYVTQEYDSCPELCDLKCSDCEACVHMYSCTCVQSMINANMCKHIHAVVQKFLTPHFSPPPSPLPDPYDDIDDMSDNGPAIVNKDPDLLESILKRMQGIYKQARLNKCHMNKNSISEVLRLLDRCHELCSKCDVSFAFESKSTQTESVPASLSSANKLNSFIKIVPGSNLGNVTFKPASQSNFGSDSKANIGVNSSVIHGKPISSLVPGLFALQNIALGSGGNANPTSIVLVPSNSSFNNVWNATNLLPVASSNPIANHLSSSLCSSAERQKQVPAIIPSEVSNPILNVIGDTMFSPKKQKTAVLSTISTPNATDNSPSISKRTLGHKLSGPVQGSCSKSKHPTKKRRLKKHLSPNDLSSISANKTSNSLLSSVGDSTGTNNSLLENKSDSSRISCEEEHTSLLISVVKNSDKLNSPSSQNQIESDAPCILTSTYSLKDLSYADNKIDSDGSLA